MGLLRKKSVKNRNKIIKNQKDRFLRILKEDFEKIYLR